jgi:hypothetical protein
MKERKMKTASVVLVAMVLILFSGIDNCWARNDFDYKDITPLRWMDPYRNPITYQQYLLSREFSQDLDARLVYSGTKGDIPICIVIHALLEPLVHSSFSTFLSDLEDEGYSPDVYTATNNGDEVALRNLLISEYDTRGIVGAIFIGDLPTAWYEMDEPEDWGGAHVEFPIDLFFMDLDGSWLDADADGMYDGHQDGSGDMQADIWVGRLLAINLTENGATERAAISNYFDKNHRYRTGGLRLQDKALAYIDNDWHMYGWENDVALAYPVTDAVTDVYQTNRDDYMLRVREATDNQYENLLICSHSSPWAHYLYWGTGPYDYSLFHNYEIQTIDVQVMFYNLFACSNCRFVEDDDMGSWYIFQSQYGLISLGSTKTGSMLCFSDYYEPLGQGATFGQAFLSWCVNDIETCAGTASRAWFYGMTLLGDPTLRLSRYAPVTGDVNKDGNIDLADAVSLLNYLFKGDASPDPPWLGDANADCAVDIADAIFLLNYLFKSGPEPGAGCA